MMWFVESITACRGLSGSEAGKIIVDFCQLHNRKVLTDAARFALVQGLEDLVNRANELWPSDHPLTVSEGPNHIAVGGTAVGDTRLRQLVTIILPNCNAAPHESEIFDAAKAALEDMNAKGGAQ